MAVNLTYELQSLERLVITVHQNIIIDDSNSKEFHSALVNEIDRIKSALVTEIFAFEDEKHLERYIQYHHQAIIRLLDQVGKSLVQNGNDLFTRDFSLECHHLLNELLSFVERHFSKYFDQDLKAPESYLRLVRKDAAKWITQSRAKLKSLDLNDVTIDAVVYAFHRFIAGSEDRHSSYRMILFVKELEKEVNRIPPANSNDLQAQIWSMALYLNYNSLKWFYLYTQIIEGILTPLKTGTEKVEALSLQLKKINQCQVKPGVAYNPEAESLKTQLNGYVIEEIEYLEKVQSLNKEQSVEQQSEGPQKLIFDLSVSQLTLLVRLMVESKILINSNVSEILRFVSKIALTRRTDSISFESLRSKYYNIEGNTKEAVKQMIFKMNAVLEKLT